MKQEGVPFCQQSLLTFWIKWIKRNVDNQRTAFKTKRQLVYIIK